MCLIYIVLILGGHMKNKIKIFSALFFSVCILISCEKHEETEINFDQRSSVIEKDDGWFYTYEIASDKTDAGEIVNPMYYVDGYNLKYLVLDGYYISGIDSETNQEIEQIQPSLPYLSLNKEYRGEIEKIDDFLNQKKYSRKITSTDLKGLNLNSIDMNDVVNLHNTAIERGKSTQGKYVNLPEALIVQDSLLDGYMWQVGYIIYYGNIAAVNIECISKEGQYLSDQTDIKMKEINDEITRIETRILDKQNFNVLSDNSIEVEGVDWNRLSKLLLSINESNEIN